MILTLCRCCLNFFMMLNLCLRVLNLLGGKVNTMDSKFISGDARSSIESRRQSRTRSRYFRQCCTDIEFLPAVGRTTDRYVQGQFFIFLKEMHLLVEQTRFSLWVNSCNSDFSEAQVCASGHMSPAGSLQRIYGCYIHRLSREN